jgi:hypothetical protein
MDSLLYYISDPKLEALEILSYLISMTPLRVILLLSSYHTMRKQVIYLIPLGSLIFSLNQGSQLSCWDFPFRFLGKTVLRVRRLGL